MIIDYFEKTISIKIVYFGPASSGTTTTIKALFLHFSRGEALYSIDSTGNRTLFFDYGTITFQNEQWRLKLHIYTTTGQDYYFITRAATFHAVDGIIFVIDFQEKVYERNLASWQELISYFSEAIKEIPMIIAFNKQDLPDKFNPKHFLNEIQFDKFRNVEIRFTIAINGEGVLNCFEDILRLILGKEQK